MGKNKDNVTIPRTRKKHTLQYGGIGEMTGNFSLEIHHPEDNGMPFLKCWNCLSTKSVKLRNKHTSKIKMKVIHYNKNVSMGRRNRNTLMI